MKGSTVFVRSVLLVVALVASADLHAQLRDDRPAPLFVVRVDKTMQQAVADLKEAIANRNYVFIRQQNIDSHLISETAENDHVVLVYFCNFDMLDHALKRNRHVGVFLPCNVTLIQKDGYIEMVAVNPKAISRQLHQKDLQGICDKLTRDYTKILQEATL